MRKLNVYNLAGEALKMRASVEHCEFMRMAIAGLASRSGGYVVAIDFDGTLHSGSAYPEIGKPIEDRITRATLARKQGIKLILWTCREGDELQAALDWCWEKGLEFDAVNANAECKREFFQNDPRKVGYDELWDDRAVDLDGMGFML